MDQQRVERELRKPGVSWADLRNYGLAAGIGVPVMGAFSPLMSAAPGVMGKLLLASGGLVAAGLGLRDWRLPPRRFWVAPDQDAGGLPLGLAAGGRRVVWPDEQMVYHALICGMSGSGKTIALKGLVAGQILRGGGVVWCDAKPSERTLQELWALCKACGRESSLRVLQPGASERSHTWNPWQWGDTEQRANLIANLRKLKGDASVTYYQDFQDLVVAAVVRTLIASKMGFHMGDVLAALISPMARERLLKIGKWKGVMDLADVMRREPRQERYDERIQGVVQLITKYARSDAGRIILHERGEIDLRDVVFKDQILYVQLPTQTAKKTAWEWGHLVVSGLSAVAGELIKHGRRPMPFLVALDEARQYFSESMADAVTQWREAGMGVVIAVQTIAQMRDRNLLEVDKQILGNTANKLFFRAESWEDADAAATEIGMEIGLMSTYTLNQGQGQSASSMGGGMSLGGRSRSRQMTEMRGVREQEDYVVRPERLRGLRDGQFYLRHPHGYETVQAPMVRIPGELPPFEKLSFPTPSGDGVGLWDAHNAEVMTWLGRLPDAERKKAEGKDDVEAAAAVVAA